ncbi:MAG: phage GP46 family protein [Proteobacteria bacterium]|nr:phage GP46 family protein [Pseudomonadota bacterium]
MRDYAIDPATGDNLFSGPNPVMTGSLLNNVHLSLSVEKGSWFANPEFGARWKDLRGKITDDTPKRAIEICDEALKWILDLQRATKIEVSAAVDHGAKRVNLKITAWQGNDPLPYEHFVRVG